MDDGSLHAILGSPFALEVQVLQGLSLTLAPFIIVPRPSPASPDSSVVTPILPSPFLKG